MTERVLKFSFSFLKFASFGLIIVYLAAVISVGSAGHSSGDTISFLSLLAYTIILAFLLVKFQKQATNRIRILLLIMLIPATAVLSFFVVMITYEVVIQKSGLIVINLLILFILMLFVAPSCIVIRSLIARNSN